MSVHSDTAQYSIGSAVACDEGVCGTLRRVVVDPVARTVTHLVVEASHRRGRGRLVPIDLIASGGSEIRIRCTQAQFEALDAAEETRFLSGASGVWDYAQADMYSLPYYGLGIGETLGMGGVAGPQSVTYDRVPVGDVEVHRGDHVHASDGPIGHVQGLVIDPADHHVTHVLLEEGHLWGQKEVAIPIGAVTGFLRGVELNLTKDEVRDLPPVDIDRRD